MSYVHVKSLEGGITLKISPEIWCYLAVTLPLMIVTILGWSGWEFYCKRNRVPSGSSMV
jgi:hypothetical protein